MTMLLSSHNVINNHARRLPCAFNPSAPSYGSEFRPRDLPPPGSVFSSLALSGSLLQTAAPIQPSLCLTARVRPSEGGSVLVGSNPSKHEERRKGWRCCQQGSDSGNSTDKVNDAEDMPNEGEASFSVPKPCTSAPPHVADARAIFASSLESTRTEEAASCIEKIERSAKASIEKLRHILYTVKTRAPDIVVPSFGSNRAEEGLGRSSRPPSFGKVRGVTWEESKEEEDHPTAERELPVADNSQEAFVQHDAVTCTRTTVKFNKETNTAIVTITATVRGPERDSALQDNEQVNQKSLILAARSLSHACASLEEKVTAAMRSTTKKTVIEAAGEAVKESEHELEHDHILGQLTTGEVLEAFEIKKGYGATPFRPVYVVKLSHGDGQVSHALMKPFVPGDAYRFSSASAEWVAYQLGQILGTDMVPPAVMRREIQVAGKTFALGTLLHYVPDVRPLTRLGPQEWGAESSVHFISNAHVLDALGGTAPRERRFFMEGIHWISYGKRRPMLLDHPMGQANGKLHAMWSPHGNVKGVQKVSNQTLASLKALNLALLQKALGSHVSFEELETILERRDQVVTYFEAICKTGPALTI